MALRSLDREAQPARKDRTGFCKSSNLNIKTSRGCFDAIGGSYLGLCQVETLNDICDSWRSNRVANNEEREAGKPSHELLDDIKAFVLFRAEDLLDRIFPLNTKEQAPPECASDLVLRD
jgi:hypothetical protein